MQYRTILRLALLCMVSMILFLESAVAKTVVAGSGASFPYQIYSLWFRLANQENNDILIEYAAKGSGSGIRDFQNHVVDFAASDAAMNDKEIEKVKEGVQLLPMTAGEVVLIYNLNGVATLNLPRDVYPKIFLGEIKKWNDPVIANANPEVNLPDLDIVVVSRSDSSGTTFVLTKHLSAISEEFKNGPGYGKKVQWPSMMKMEKRSLNLGISATVNQIPGAIGYLDYGFSILAGHKMVSLENKNGKFITPGLEGGMAALANGEIPENMIVWLSDPAGDKSYPITTYTWMMFYKKYDDPNTAEALRKMITFCLDKGQKISDRYGYIPLPDTVAKTVRAAAENIQ